MAKALTSPLVGAVSGSQGGTTFVRTRGGLVIRKKSPRRGGGSPSAGRVIGYNAAWASRWRELSPEEQAAWETYARQQDHYDALGQLYQATGQQAFCRANSLRALWASQGGVQVRRPPPIRRYAALRIVDFRVRVPVFGPPDLEISALVTDPPIVAGSVFLRWMVRSSGPISAGQAFIARERYRILTSARQGTVFGVINPLGTAFRREALRIAWGRLFGPTAHVGQRVSILVSLLDIRGSESLPVRADALVTT